MANDEPDLAVALDGALWRVWLTRGFADEVRRELTDALSLSRGDPVARARALNAVGVLAGEADDLGAARSALEEAIALATEIGELRQKARALGNLGLVDMWAGESDAALAGYGKALELWRELGNAKGQSVIAQNMAIVHERLGQIEEAMSLLEQAVELAHTTGDRMHVASTLIAFGRILLSRRPEDSRIPAMLREAVELSVALGSRYQTIESLEAVADLASRAGQPVAAARLIGAAEAERERQRAWRKPDELPFYGATVEKLEQALGPEAYEQERARGRRMSLDEAIAAALESTARASDPA
jgi:tetratricopeptide (TPR) repeat protein